jgi:hypothetical protein
MFEILVSVCFIAEPGRCRDVRLDFVADNVTPRQCLTVGQVEIARWIDGHPNWQVKRWSCAPAGRTANT